MHSILLAHHILATIPLFDASHARVVRKVIQTVAAHSGDDLPSSALRLGKSKTKWAADNSAALVFIAASRSFKLQVKNQDILSVEGNSDAAKLYALVISGLHSWLRSNDQYLDECHATVSQALSYLSLPLTELQMNHKAYLKVMARCSANRNEVSPEVFVLSELGRFERRGLLGMMFGN